MLDNSDSKFFHSKGYLVIEVGKHLVNGQLIFSITLHLFDLTRVDFDEEKGADSGRDDSTDLLPFEETLDQLSQEVIPSDPWPDFVSSVKERDHAKLMKHYEMLSDISSLNFYESLTLQPVTLHKYTFVGSPGNIEDNADGIPHSEKAQLLVDMLCSQVTYSMLNHQSTTQRAQEMETLLEAWAFEEYGIAVEENVFVEPEDREAIPEWCSFDYSESETTCNLHCYSDAHRTLLGYSLERSGRLNGAEIADSSKQTYGKRPLSSKDKNVCSGYSTREGPHGTIGVVLKLCYGLETR